MISTSLSAFRKHINSYLEEVTTNCEELIVRLGRNKAVVVLSLDECNSLMTTGHELSSKNNELRLDAAIAKAEGRATFERDLLY